MPRVVIVAGRIKRDRRALLDEDLSAVMLVSVICSTEEAMENIFWKLNQHGYSSTIFCRKEEKHLDRIRLRFIAIVLFGIKWLLEKEITNVNHRKISNLFCLLFRVLSPFCYLLLAACYLLLVTSSP
jgi:hypothetical protein